MPRPAVPFRSSREGGGAGPSLSRGRPLLRCLDYILAVAGPHHGVGHIADRIAWVLRKMDIGAGGYVVLFGLLFSCGLGVPIPEDIPLLVAGALVGSGHMHLAVAAICAWCGIIAGDCVLYYMGRRFGLNITRLPVIGKHVTKHRIHWTEQRFHRYGVWVVAVGRLFAGIRGAMVVAAGTIKFNFIKFLIADGAAAVVSGGLFLFLGIEFGQNLPKVAEVIHRSGWWILGGLIVFVLGFLAFKFVEAGRRKVEKKAEIHEEIAGGLDPRISKVTVSRGDDATKDRVRRVRLPPPA
jgi:membrane protein DedA with SNARE-associated domain